MSDTLFFDLVSVHEDRDSVDSFSSDAHVVLGRGNWSSVKSQALRVCGYNAGYSVWITPGLFVGVRKDFLNGKPSVAVREFTPFKTKLLSVEVDKDDAGSFAFIAGVNTENLAVDNFQLAKSLGLTCNYLFLAGEGDIQFENFNVDDDEESSNYMYDSVNNNDHGGNDRAVSFATLSND